MYFFRKMTSKVVQDFENREIEKIKAQRLADAQVFDNVKTGDSIIIGVKLQDDASSRIQEFAGVVIGVSNKGLRTRIVVKRTASGNHAIVQSFMIYLSSIQYIKKISSGRVRRAKAYYLIERKGKSARLKQVR